MSGIRAEPRTAMMATVDVSWVDQSGTPHDAPATLEDKSPSGACIRIKSPVTVGSILNVSGYREHFAGVTMYCRNERGAYLVGILKDSARNFVAAAAALPSRSARVAPPRENAPHEAHVVAPPVIQPPSQAQESATAATPETRRPAAALPFVPRARTGVPVPVPAPAASTGSNFNAGLRQGTDFHPEVRRAAVPKGISDSGVLTPEAPRARERFTHATSSTLHPEPDSISPISTQSALRLAQPKEAIVARGAGYVTQLPQSLSDKERTTMPNKWTDLAPWRKQQDPQAPDASAAVHRADAKSASVPSPAESSATASGSANFLGDLLSVDDIYRAAGILVPRMGYSILKVADMLASDHLRGLADELKRGSVLMALDAAGISVDEVLRDAELRQSAINSYESDQWQHFEEHWSAKAAENAHVQAELDRATAQYQERIRRNLDEVAQEKIVFAEWQTMKQHEAQRIAEAAEICARSSAAESLESSAPAPRGLAANAKNA